MKDNDRDDKKNIYVVPYFPKPDDFVPEELFPIGHKREGKLRCSAWAKQVGRQCSNSPLVNHKVCKNHQGQSKYKGELSSGYKHGAYVPDTLPRDVMANVLKIINNPDINQMNFERQVASYSLEMYLLNKLFDKGDSSDLWDKLSQQYKLALKAQKKGKDGVKNFKDAFEEIGQLINRGEAFYNNLKGLRDQQTHTNKLNESEQKRLMAVPLPSVIEAIRVITEECYQKVILKHLDRKLAAEIINEAEKEKTRYLNRQDG